MWDVLHRQPAEGALIAAFATGPRRWCSMSRPAVWIPDGAGVPGLSAEATKRGQTVFLSSHHLAEVEAVCDRVGTSARLGWSRSPDSLDSPVRG